MNNFPRRFQFQHELRTYNADLVVEGNASSSATGECCICRQPLRGRPHYATDPALLRLHADCAQQLLRQQQQQRSLHWYPHQQQQYMIGSYPLYQYHPPPPPPPPPWSWHPNYWNNGGYGHHYNNINPGSSSPVSSAIGTVALGAFLQAFFGSLLNG